MKLLACLLVLFVAVWAGIFLADDPGVAWLTYKSWSVEMPLWLLFAAVFISFTLVFGVLNSLAVLRASLSSIHNFIYKRNKKISRENTEQAMLALAEGAWQQAEKKLIKAVGYSEMPLINYLSAAKAAHEQGAIKRRDEYLATAEKISPKSEVSIGLTQAHMQFRQGQFNDCLTTLKRVKNLAPNHTGIIKSLAMLYETMDDWSQVSKILPEIRKNKILSKGELNRLENKTLSTILKKIAKEKGQQELIAYWQNMPKAQRDNNQLVKTYAENLIKLMAPKEAEKALRYKLRKSWDPELVKLYGFVITSDLGKQITTAEAWLKTYPEDPVLLLALARLCLRHQLWGKARSYLELSIELKPSAESYAELGRLLGFLGETEKCRDCYQKGLLSVTDVLQLETK
jgi:HemY protein